MRHSQGQPGPRAPRPREVPAGATARSPSPRPRPPSAEICRQQGSVGLQVFIGLFATMPLYEGLGSGGEKTAVVIDLGEAFTK